MLLKAIVEQVDLSILQGDLNKHISSLSYDSRHVKSDGLFVAISGFYVDGHDYINSAIKHGAVAIIVEKDIKVDENITILKVSNSRDALAKLSANFFSNPSASLDLIGITGTNGKTSITYFLKSIFEQAQTETAIIGTNGTFIKDQLIETANTTPESLDLQALLSKIRDSYLKKCLIEVSSHALHLDRVAHVNFNTAVFTNLTPDHLELHSNMDDYFHAKTKLFDKTHHANVINVDDPYGRKLIDMHQDSNVKTITYGIHNQADIYATNIEYAFEKTTFNVNTPIGNKKVTVHLPGEIYVYNSLAAIATAYGQAIPLETIVKGINKLTSIDGRFEIVYQKGDFKIIIDFAHTEDALKKTLNTVRPYVKGKIILVFGVYADGSDSGKNKRFSMGKVAAEYSDLAIVTLDNPKNNDQDSIIHDIVQAITLNNGHYTTILNREKAILYAIKVSNDNDVIVIAGKGHETTQIIGNENIPFNETEIVLNALAVRT